MMSSESFKKKKEENIGFDIFPEKSLEITLSEIVIPFSSFIEKKMCSDIYKGYEKIPFQQRHPIYKAILKIEFEEAVQEFWSNKKNSI